MMKFYNIILELYKLIVPQKELKQLITDEINTFNKEIADKSIKQKD